MNRFLNSLSIIKVYAFFWGLIALAEFVRVVSFTVPNQAYDAAFGIFFAIPSLIVLVLAGLLLFAKSLLMQWVYVTSIGLMAAVYLIGRPVVALLSLAVMIVTLSALRPHAK